MKSYLTILSLLLILSIQFCIGQTILPVSYLRNSDITERKGTGTFASADGSIPFATRTKPKMKGNVYLTDHYNPSAFELYGNDKLVEGVTSKLDLHLNEFDIITDKGVQVLGGNLVRTFLYRDSLTQKQSVFINGKGLKTKDNVSLNCFLEILSNGSITLLKRTELVFKRPDYDPVLNVGSKDPQCIKKVNLLYAQNNIVEELPGKKSIPSIFGNAEADVQKFIKTNQLNLAKENNIIALFEYYNSKNAATQQ